MWGVQEMGIVLVLVLVPCSCLVDWLVTVEGGRRKEVLRWWWWWYSVVCSGVECGVEAKESKM